MKQINCLLFDLDGTLLDSRDSVIDALYDTTEKFLPGCFSRDDLLARFGESFTEYMREIEQRLPDWTDKSQFLKTYFDHIQQFHDEKVRLFPRVKEGLQLLKQTGFRLGIVTNKQRDLTLSELRLAQIQDYFDTIVTLDDVRAGKPAAEPVLKAMAQLGAQRVSTLMVGDSKYDVLAAKAANVKSAVLEWYGTDSWPDAVPDYRFADFDRFVGELTTVKS